MKPLVAIGWLTALLIFVPETWSQGTVQFQNDSTTRITNCHTRLPQLTRTVKLGLYFTPDLAAVSNVAARASMLLARVTTNGPVDGRFAGGSVSLPGVAVGSLVVLQIKAWPLSYATFEEAVAAGAEVAESLPWVQATGGSVFPPTMISRWGFRAFLYPQCEPIRVPILVERVASSVRVCWPVGVPPSVQVREAGSTNWTGLTNGVFVTDHWEFEFSPTSAMQWFRLAQ